MPDPVREPSRGTLRAVLVVSGFVFSFLLVVLFIYPALHLLPSILIMVAITFMLVRAYSVGYKYRCGNCGKSFHVPLMVDFLTPSGVGKNPDGTFHSWKSLTCPHCGERSHALVLRRALGDALKTSPWADDEAARGNAGGTAKGGAKGSAKGGPKGGAKGARKGGGKGRSR